MRQFLVVLAACAGVLLLAVAFLSVGLGVLLPARAGGIVLVGFLMTFVVCFLPGLALYRFAGRFLQGPNRWRMHAALAICVAGSAVLLGSWYASGYFDPKVVLRDGVLEINGRLDRETVQQFRNVAVASDLRGVRVRLRSPGGDVHAGMAIGRELRRLQLDVEVDGLCVSSCANYLFTAGRNKYVESTDLVRFHGGALQPNFVEEVLRSLEDGTQMVSPDLGADRTLRRERRSLEELRNLYGYRADLPLNGAGWILSEKAFFDEIGASNLTPVFGQYGEYAPWFDDGVHDSYYYTVEDFAQLGVTNIHLSGSAQVPNTANDEAVFRARTNAAAIEALQTEMDALVKKIEAAMPFDASQVWARND